jgi:hypothetical protein
MNDRDLFIIELFRKGDPMAVNRRPLDTADIARRLSIHENEAEWQLHQALEGERKARRVLREQRRATAYAW